MRPRWLIVGLIASVALNLFLVGAGAGVIALGMQMAGKPPSTRPGAFFWASQALPQPDRRAFRQMLTQVRRDTRADSDHSLAVRTQAWGALADPKPDVATIKQQLEQGRQTDIAVRARAEERIVDYVAGLAPADRALFAAGMRRMLRPPTTQTAPESNATNAAG
jgi:uncharacterized membrane protein